MRQQVGRLGLHSTLSNCINSMSNVPCKCTVQVTSCKAQLHQSMFPSLVPITCAPTNPAPFSCHALWSMFVYYHVNGSVLFTHANCRKSWALVREDSVFVDWQRVKVQENADEVRCRIWLVSIRNRQMSYENHALHTCTMGLLCCRWVWIERTWSHGRHVVAILAHSLSLLAPN